MLAVGLIITAFLSWRSFQAQNYQRLQSFIQLAICESDLMMHKLQSIGSRELRGLANFFIASDEVTEEEFKLFASPQRQKCLYRIKGWGKAVTDADRARFRSSACDAKTSASWSRTGRDSPSRQSPRGLVSSYSPTPVRWGSAHHRLRP